MPKRYLGNIITDTPTAPAGPYENDAASGVWSLAEANAYTAAGLWPTAGSTAPIGLFGGGGGTRVDTIDQINIASTGDATDFGDLIAVNIYPAACSSSTRGVWAAGSESASTRTNRIQYVTIASAGNAIDFGDLTLARYNGVGGLSNNTRGVIAGGE